MASLLFSADKDTVTTVKLEIEVQRTESVTQITCSQCSRTGEVRKVEFAPPASIGSPVVSCRVPDGWWVQGASYLSFKGTCPECFEQRSSGARSADSREKAEPSTREERPPKAAVDSDRDRPVDSAWHAILSTPGGASAVARAVAIHLGQTVESIRGTNLRRVIETLEAASARLEEFRPKDAAEVDLAPLGERPFAAPFEAASIVEAVSSDSEPHQSSFHAATVQDLFERMERVFEHGGSVLVSGSSRFNDASRRAFVKMSNDDRGINLTASATRKTMVAALASALAKAGI